MALLRKRSWPTIFGEFTNFIRYSRFYSSKANLKKHRLMILKRIQSRAKYYPVPDMIPVAKELVRARTRLIHGVSSLLKVFPIVTCQFCPEVYIGENGHLIKTCCGPRRKGKKFLHQWVSGGLSDILVPVEAFHLKTMFQDIIEHHQRFDFDRVPAVLELCWQAGAHPDDETVCSSTSNFESIPGDVEGANSLSPDDLMLLARETFKAWEMVRSDVQRLLLVYPAKVCTYCSEVHVGPSGHKARLCGIFKHENFRGTHFWKTANVDNLVPQKIVWRRRPHDPPILRDERRSYYGHLPAVVELCAQAGFIPPPEYEYMMKEDSLRGRVVVKP